MRSLPLRQVIALFPKWDVADRVTRDNDLNPAVLLPAVAFALE